MLTSFISALRDRGFDYIKRDKRSLVFHGKLTTEGQTHHSVEVSIHDSFTSPPKVRLLEIPAGIPPAVPHLTEGGALCYLDSSTVVFDTFDPITDAIACLNYASHVLGKVLDGDLDSDIEDEFYAYWGYGGFCFADFENEEPGQYYGVVYRDFKNFPRLVVTDKVERTTDKLESLGFKLEQDSFPAYRVNTKVKPRAHPLKWPPETVRDILAWQGRLDPNCRRKLEQRIKDGGLTTSNKAIFIIESPLYTYGFGVMYPKPSQNNAPKHYKKTVLYKLKAASLSVERIDYRYMSQRNIPQLKTLSGKSITVVGCGTIGGYLVDMLIKSGAGLQGGKVTLIDPDELAPQNIGRHRLGVPSLFKNKAQELGRELTRNAPGINIKALPVSVLAADISGADLLVDATGVESIGHWLCKMHHNVSAMLTVWIEGPGIAVRSLLRRNHEDACYRCLYEENSKGRLLAVNEPAPAIYAGQGCEGRYVQYPAFISIQAAALASEMVLNWANNRDTSRLRTKVTDDRFSLATPDFSPNPVPGCPACSL